MVTAAAIGSGPSTGISEATDGNGRSDLLRVAIDLFARNGYAGTSMRDIAGAARCSVANVYHHFRNKEALWLSILTNAVQHLPATLSTAASDTPAGQEKAPLARIERLVRTHIATTHRIPRELRILFVDEGGLSAESNAVNQQLQHAILHVYQAELLLLVQAGIVRDSGLKIKALNILGVINWHLRWMARDATPAQQLAEADTIVAFILRAVDERDGRGDAA